MIRRFSSHSRNKSCWNKTSLIEQTQSGSRTENTKSQELLKQKRLARKVLFNDFHYHILSLVEYLETTCVCLLWPGTGRPCVVSSFFSLHSQNISEHEIERNQKKFSSLWIKFLQSKISKTFGIVHTFELFCRSIRGDSEVWFCAS